MRYLVAPDKFKGSLSAAEVADVVGAAIQSADPTAEIELLPIADGGEGTAEESPPAGCVTDEADYFRLADYPPTILDQTVGIVPPSMM